MKKLRGFSFSINMAFEGFWGVKKLGANLSFLKCDVSIMSFMQNIICIMEIYIIPAYQSMHKTYLTSIKQVAF